MRQDSKAFLNVVQLKCGQFNRLICSEIDIASALVVFIDRELIHTSAEQRYELFRLRKISHVRTSVCLSACMLDNTKTSGFLGNAMFRFCLFVLTSFLCVLIGKANASDFDIKPLQEKILKTIEKVQPAVVAIRGQGAFFSGVIVSKEGHILSAGHAVQSGRRYRVVLPDGRQLRAVGKGSNPSADCALLKITSEDEDIPFVRMGDSEALVRNQPCLSLSFPGGQGTRGVPVVRFGRVLRAHLRNGMLQSTALMEPGDSGGPLFDLQGRVIGIHSRIGANMQRNYEVPVNTFKKFWNELNREQMFIQSGPPVPKLGFVGRDRDDDTGIDVRQVVEGTLADDYGLKPGDIIKSVYGKETLTIRELRKALIAARDDDADEITVQVFRDEEDVDLNVTFDVEREAAPDVDLPKYEDRSFAKPSAIRQLANLPDEFADLESKLDDVCVEIRSELSDGEELEIVGTLIKGTEFVISKSSMVAQGPEIEIDGAEVNLEIVARDSDNDLVLLKRDKVNDSGVELNESEAAPEIGSFLLTPEADGNGLISIISTKPFKSRKQQSRGFLDVMPVDYKDRGGAELKQVNRNGAADKAGLEVGDVITQIDETPIRSHMELRRFLGTVDPNNTIMVKIKRDEEELEKSIRLGAFPSMTRHAADMMNKSGRRDGFSEVIPHDADLDPENCGSPLFDLAGNFVGLNIARNSRVRSYAIPRSIIKALVDKN